MVKKLLNLKLLIKLYIIFSSLAGTDVRLTDSIACIFISFHTSTYNHIRIRRYDYSRFYPNIKTTVANVQIHMLSFYNNYTLCDFTTLKLAMITINRINDNEI